MRSPHAALAHSTDGGLQFEVVHIVQISCLSLTCGCMQLFLPSIKPQRPGESTSTLRCVHRCPLVARQHQARPHCRPQMAPHRWREGQSGCTGRRHRMNVRATVCNPLPRVRRVPFAHQQGSCMLFVRPQQQQVELVEDAQCAGERWRNRAHRPRSLFRSSAGRLWLQHSTPATRCLWCPRL